MGSFSPRKITVIWELGGGMGHAARLAPIIQALVAAGHHLNVVARAPRRLYESLDDSTRDSAALTYFRAPALPPRATVRGGARPVCATMADILIEDGFAEPVGLTSYLGEWRRLLGSLTPVLVISDFSPFANLVAADMAPLLVVGNGYAIPPAGNISFLDRPLSRQSIVNYDRLLAVLTTAARGVGAPAPAGIGEMFRGGVNFPLTFPILDPYGGRRPEQVLTPHTLPQRPDILSEPTEVFVYLPGSHAALPAVIQALTAESWPARVYAPGAAPDAVPDTPSLRRLPQPAQMAALLPRVHTIVHSGGLGLAHAGLVAGARQVLLPTCIEQHLTANALVRQGVGVSIGKDAASYTAAVVQALDHCRHAPVLAERVAHLAATCPTDGASSLDAILAAVARLLG